MAGEAQLPGRETSQAEFAHICHRYLAAAGLVDKKVVLDVGCGAGLGLAYLSKRASRVVGTDLFGTNIALAARQCGPNASVAVVDAHRLAFPDNCFDVILAMEVAQYLRMEEFLEEARRVLVPAGTLFVCVPNPDRPGFVRSRGAMSYYSSGELGALLEREGFDPDVRGVFPCSGAAQRTLEDVGAGVIRLGVQLLDFLAPALHARRIKDFLRKILGYKAVRLQDALQEDKMLRLKSVAMEDLSSVRNDARHTFLYAFARSRKDFHPSEG
jgi:SAM-dependent methyltransferase